MDANRNRVREISIARTIERLRKNNIEAAYLPSGQDVVPMLRSILDEGCTIALGGSATLAETGVLKLVRSDLYHLIDRYEPNLDPHELHQRLIDAFSADVFLTSVNAITEHGELYCVDGTSNRVSAMLFGPKRVIVIAGWQKIVPTLRDAIDRVKHIAAPANAMRLEKDTPCVKTGHCIAPYCDDHHLMAIPTGACDNGICSNMVVMGRQAKKGRLSVLIVGEQLGY
ncbi:lactate utilization protein [Pleomorphochaeta sp. DL1XJH-081]|uniref:lactate utilization protein n=1 Tax=Pleomorphochaeta sp. DL1XJH-081 TaxID=3409690 RepID=UPI003BB7AE82